MRECGRKPDQAQSTLAESIVMTVIRVARHMRAPVGSLAVANADDRAHDHPTRPEYIMTRDIVQTSAADTLPPFDPAAFWTQFHHDTVVIEGVRLHFVDGGSGAPILLLPGWPESWYAWRYVMPLLAKAGRRVIALDPRGVGDSDRPASGYELRTVAAELHGFVEALRLTANGPVDIVGHDLGTWIGYAYSAEWPGDVKRLVVFDAAAARHHPAASGRHSLGRSECEDLATRPSTGSMTCRRSCCRDASGSS